MTVNALFKMFAVNFFFAHAAKIQWMVQKHQASSLVIGLVPAALETPKFPNVLTFGPGQSWPMQSVKTGPKPRPCLAVFCVKTNYFSAGISAQTQGRAEEMVSATVGLFSCEQQHQRQK